MQGNSKKKTYQKKEQQENATGNECWLDASGRKKETENH
jgi:hypothetical protein